jgi:extracellular elastinolytic metalloproteinase
MYLFNRTNVSQRPTHIFSDTEKKQPKRDDALPNDIISHEATHGTSNQLTGGGTERCLQTDEAGGLGEGWSDAFANWTEQKPAPIRDTVLE